MWEVFKVPIPQSISFLSLSSQAFGLYIVSTKLSFLVPNGRVPIKLIQFLSIVFVEGWALGVPYSLLLHIGWYHSNQSYFKIKITFQFIFSCKVKENLTLNWREWKVKSRTLNSLMLTRFTFSSIWYLWGSIWIGQGQWFQSHILSTPNLSSCFFKYFL